MIKSPRRPPDSEIKTSRFFSRNVTVFASLIISLAVVELGMRIFLSEKQKRDRYMRIRNVFQYEEKNIHFDEELGYMTNSNLAVPFRNPEFETRVRTNSYGFRDDEDSLANPDLLLLGDSFAFGWGVNEDQSCEKTLERGGHGKVLNMGVPGYGTIQEYLLLRRWGQGRDLRNKIVVFLFYGNDFWDNQGFLVYPRMEIEGRRVTFSKIRDADFAKWLSICRMEMSGGVAGKLYSADLLRQEILELGRRFSIFEQGPVADVDEVKAVKTFHVVMAGIKALSEERGFRVLFVFVPSVKSFDGQSEEGLRTVVKTILSKFSVPLIDLSRVLSRDDYYKCDDHWNVGGHRKAAREIGRFLDEHPSAGSKISQGTANNAATRPAELGGAGTAIYPTGRARGTDGCG